MAAKDKSDDVTPNRFSKVLYKFNSESCSVSSISMTAE